MSYKPSWKKFHIFSSKVCVCVCVCVCVRERERKRERERESKCEWRKNKKSKIESCLNVRACLRMAVWLTRSKGLRYKRNLHLRLNSVDEKPFNKKGLINVWNYLYTNLQQQHQHLQQHHQLQQHHYHQQQDACVAGFIVGPSARCSIIRVFGIPVWRHRQQEQQLRTRERRFGEKVLPVARMGKTPAFRVHHLQPSRSRSTRRGP